MPQISPYAHLLHPMFSAPVPPPRNDKEATDLIRQSKVSLDHHTALNKDAHPAVKAAFQAAKQSHVDHVALAMHRYHKATPTAISQRIINAMHSDPSLKISHPKPTP